MFLILAGALNCVETRNYSTDFWFVFTQATNNFGDTIHRATRSFAASPDSRQVSDSFLLVQYHLFDVCMGGSQPVLTRTLSPHLSILVANCLYLYLYFINLAMAK